ncbi:phage scaffolding protein [Desulfosporosinus youngiae]|uniref:Phage minor structural protein n=1 Tax=Desulfosporosinus youngiae DSM 17734 TaxID=768710 RepID=H5Y0B9_9FIRM|nr:phage scaffolding protein [Desulfosporosinus youngiae]EHQ92098.1 Phage minor structural protein [Desulfosporosinus youngiae DSM 17734]
MEKHSSQKVRVLLLCRRFGTAGVKEQDITGHDRAKSDDERTIIMNKEQFLALGLREELAVKAAAASQVELRSYIPKLRFDEVNGAKKQLEKDIATRDKQIEDLKKVDTAGLQVEIINLRSENKKAKENYEADVKAITLTNALKLALTGKAHDPDIVASLLDKTKIELNENGSIKVGLDDQLKSLKESKAFLFSEEKKENQGFQFKGVRPVEGSAPKEGFY